MQRKSSSARINAGFTLVELMIAMMLGLLLIGGVVALFLQSNESFRVDENVARMQDQARFAMDELGRDAQMAGFIAEPVSSAAVSLDPSLAVANGCGPAGEDDWIVRLTDVGTGEDNMLTGLDNATAAQANAAFECLDSGEFSAGTDVISIKRMAARLIAPADVQDGRIYVQSNGTVGLLFKEPAVGPLVGVSSIREYRPRIYYIRNYGAVEGDGIPTLCRKQLGSGDPAPVDTDCVAQGIENLQVEYGLDLDGDGAANQYLADPTLAEIQNIVSVHITLLARTVTPDRRYTDTRAYQVGNAPAYSPNDNFHRRIYSVTVAVPNLRNLRRLGS